MDAVVDHLGLPGGEELHKDRSQAHPQDQKDHPADQIDEVAVGHYPVGLVGPVLPSRRASKALKPTPVPTHTAIIRVWIG